ncbi:GmrSD restriction endonuclease domain-containing protein [Pseudomonas chlororaphis subsp. piscium]
MALKSNLVNLDAMITRADFAIADADTALFENVPTISLREFSQGGMMGPNLRKPDFQRETNHWAPDQVVSLLECFVDGDLIPSVILWQSPTYLFVIDGCHRLSVLRAWVEDDYGDGPISQNYFGYEIPQSQKDIARKTRDLVAKKVGTWKHYQTRSTDLPSGGPDRKRLNTVISRGLPIQWVKGDADKAESSFFKINMKGTPLDDIEELLLRSRKKPVPIAARAIIRSGKGHKYWSSFPEDAVNRIELAAKNLHSTLFDPELRRPIKTLDLPLGGPKAIRAALQTLIDFILVSVRNQQGEPKAISDMNDDPDGSDTVRALERALSLARRVTGNDNGSLGLHPAVYFYGPTGRHSGAMFMGTVILLGRKIANNDQTFFSKFTKARERLEKVLVDDKELIATILQKSSSKSRSAIYADLLDNLIKALHEEKNVTEEDIIKFSGMEGKVFVGALTAVPKTFSEDTKSQAFINLALSSAPKCPLCNGFLDSEKSVSYDHIVRAREGGLGTLSNLQLTHPYCNQSIKN